MWTRTCLKPRLGKLFTDGAIPGKTIVMGGIRRTVAQVVRLALPYFRSEDRWAARGLLAAVLAIELAHFGIAVLLKLLECALL